MKMLSMCVRRRVLGLVGFLCVASLTVTACGGSTTTSAGGRPELKVAAVFLPSAIDPAKGIDAVFSFVETLTKVDNTGHAVPYLLTQAPTQVDATHWTLALRPGITFQNGNPVTAATVAAGMNREVQISDSGKASLPGAVFSASGDLTVAVDTRTPQPLLPFALADRAFAVYDEPTVAKAGDAPDALAGKGVFTAPYAVTSFSTQAMKLTAYDRYWQGKPALSGVTVTLVSDSTARAAAVESGQADVADGANAPDVLQLVKGRSDVSMKLSAVPLLRVKMYLNPAAGPFTDPQVRRAVLMALDYQQLGSQFSGGIGEPATGLLPGTYPLTVATQHTDTAAASALLDAAGWVKGPDGMRAKGGRPLNLALLTYNERAVMKPLSIGIQTMLATIGVGTTITSQPYDAKMYDDPGKWNIALYNDYSISPTGAPDSYLQQDLSSGGGNNKWHITDPALDALLATLQTSTDRAGALAAVQKYVWDQGYVASVAFVKEGALVGRKWSAYVPGDGYQQQEWSWTTAPSS